ncbi:MAG: glycosyltransferase [Lachnospiraceae bacterium]|nr:glycosyltransferase [Lachnospiraceae bacterium]
MIRVSVVIPTYNMAEYISVCLDSVIAQTLNNIEVLIIDDGSTDNTSDLVMKYCQENSNIRYIYQKNSGSGNARNIGIRAAMGEYIAFMDADDFYHANDILETLYTKAITKKAVMCGGDICYLRNGKISSDGMREGMKVENEGWVEKENYPTIDGYVTYIYKNSFLKQNNLFFLPYLRNQDVPFFLNCIAKAGRVYRIKKDVYCYRKGHKNVNWTIEKVLGYAEGVRDELEICRNNGLKLIYRSRCKELHGEFSALLYFYATQSGKVKKLISEINRLIDIKNEENGTKFKFLEQEEIGEYVRRIEKEEHELTKICKLFDKKIIFGAGDFGRRVIKYFKEVDIRVEAVGVSNTENNPPTVEGVKVCSIDDFVPCAEEYLVIVAVYPFLQNEVKELLQKKKFHNVYFADLEQICLYEYVKNVK